MKYVPLECKSALHCVKRNPAFKWDLNIYRGCEHGCRYCFAIYSHDYLNDGHFFETVYYKKNIIQVLEKELSSAKWKKDVISIGGVTDSYQPIEKELGLMRDVLKLMIKYRNPIIISTKSTLILRDLDLLTELAKYVPVHVAFTITTIDEKVRSSLEPFGSPSLDRFKALARIKKTGATIGVHIMPIIPYVTDNCQNLEGIYALASKIQADYVLPGMLYLRGKTRPFFFSYVSKNYPSVYQKLQTLYQSKEHKMHYKKGLYAYIASLEKKYHLSSDFKKNLKLYQKIPSCEQLSLFKS